MFFTEESFWQIVWTDDKQTKENQKTRKQKHIFVHLWGLFEPGDMIVKLV